MLKVKDLDENIYTVKFQRNLPKSLMIQFDLVPEDASLPKDFVVIDPLYDTLIETLKDQYYTVTEEPS